ncbi:MAG: iron-sulfur cluster assembly accessory protein [Elusimicrobia bacterium]|nr:iron-sulfur cluster assembly accessory protein [Elusimicrobiota bacterium]
METLTLTPSAVTKVKEFFATQPEAKGKSLRIGLEPSGCAGYEYVFVFDQKKPTDQEILCDGFSILLDPNCVQFLSGSTVDYAESTAGSGFQINNPNVKKSCGCGKSNSF